MSLSLLAMCVLRKKKGGGYFARSFCKNRIRVRDVVKNAQKEHEGLKKGGNDSLNVILRQRVGRILFVANRRESKLLNRDLAKYLMTTFLTFDIFGDLMDAQPGIAVNQTKIINPTIRLWYMYTVELY